MNWVELLLALLERRLVTQEEWRRPVAGLLNGQGLEAALEPLNAMVAALADDIQRQGLLAIMPTVTAPTHRTALVS